VAKTFNNPGTYVYLNQPSYNPATIEGTAAGDAYGVLGKAGRAWTVTNLGTVAASNGDGIRLRSGGTVSNGSAAATATAIYGSVDGVLIQAAKGSVANFATIAGGRYGVYLADGGAVTNGSTDVTTSSIAGGTGNGIQVAGAADRRRPRRGRQWQ